MTRRMRSMMSMSMRMMAMNKDEDEVYRNQPWKHKQTNTVAVIK
jgi:hypothetical protein